MEAIFGFFSSWVIFAGIFPIHLIVPARRVTGYVKKTASEERLQYRLNGPFVLVVAIGIWIVLGLSGSLPWNWLWFHRWSGFIGAITLGVLTSIAVVVTAPSRGQSWLTEIYRGRRENPQILNHRVDSKMLLYLSGAVLLQLNLLSFAAHHLLSFLNDPSPGVLLYVALLTWFVCDYLVFERVHLYTYDLFAERVGFKLIWGCLAWYPYFYAVGLWGVADLPNPHLPIWYFVIAALVFYAGWILARGSNMQKFTFKTESHRTYLGLFAPKSLSNGEHALLYSGFWGMSRHVNYLGEVLMAVGLTLALGWPLELAPWLYPCYYVALLVPRQIQDDKRCAKKYGELWRRYCEYVPWRIVPRIY